MFVQTELNGVFIIWCFSVQMTLIIAQLVKKFDIFYGTQMFVTVFTRFRHWALSWARWIHSAPSHHTFL